jgi:ribosomal protein S18 acetylase RimI-like enzyme
VSGPAAPPRIRDARADEAGRIGEIARAAYRKYMPRIGREPAPMGADFAAEIAAGRVVVAAAGDLVAGYMIAWPERGAYFIDSIAVDPAAQGRGFGRLLMDHAERAARQRGLAAIRLYTNAAMTENLSLYRHLGFVETHRAIDQGFNHVFMRRDLETETACVMEIPLKDNTSDGSPA